LRPAWIPCLKEKPNPSSPLPSLSGKSKSAACGPVGRLSLPRFPQSSCFSISVKMSAPHTVGAGREVGNRQTNLDLQDRAKCLQIRGQLEEGTLSSVQGQTTTVESHRQPVLLRFALTLSDRASFTPQPGRVTGSTQDSCAPVSPVGTGTSLGAQLSGNTCTRQRWHPT
jgi:hypothetical protein